MKDSPPALAAPAPALPTDRAVEPAGIESFFSVQSSYTGAGRAIPGGGITRWILTEGPRLHSEVAFFDELCWRLIGDGVPLWRATLHFGTLHPQIRGFSARWWLASGVTEEIQIAHGSETTDEYLRSPIRDAIENGVGLRRRLDREQTEYPLLTTIRLAGGTDYIALPLNLTFRRYPVVSWTTDRAGGFDERDVGVLEEINPALAAIVESRAIRKISANLLDTYLGPQAGQRILNGQIQRGTGERMRAVIMATDLRGFTNLSDRLSDREMIALLDDYFEAVTSPIHERQGEVLKFIGDGVLAIFPTEGDDFAPSAKRALEAANAGLARLDEINAIRRGRGDAEIRIGIGLHLGEVIYGNVGAVDRLDFTVIGPAVNLASRLEGLTKRFVRPLVTSHDFAMACPLPLVSLGFQPVRGFGEPEEVFGLPEPE